MAVETNETSPAPAQAAAAVDTQERDNWFTATPDPWVEIVSLRHDGDRTYASTVNRMITSAEPAQHATMEGKLVEALAQPNLTDAGRQFVCRMLGLIGTPACVPAVAPLLEQDRMADDARLALDGIRDPAVDQAYRAALARLTGRAKSGLIGSIALRGDREALAPLTAIALDPAEPTEVRTIAERAVERISALS